MARKRTLIYEKNPFITQISGLKTRAKRVTAKGGKAIIDTTTGEVEDVAEIVSVHRVDNEQFVKIFTSNLKQFFNLKPTTYRMVQVLLHQLGRARDRDTVYLNVSVAEQYFISTDQNPISKASYYNAMRELIKRVHRREHQPEPLLDKSRAVFQRRPRSVCEGIPQHRLATTATRPG